MDQVVVLTNTNLDMLPDAQILNSDNQFGLGSMNMYIKHKRNYVYKLTPEDMSGVIIKCYTKSLWC